jgi:acid phosphatase (class A)
MMNKKRSILFLTIMFVFFSTQAFSRGGNFVSREQVNLSMLLAPPPSDDSAKTRAEIAELIEIQKMRTPQEKASAIADADLSVFQLGSDVFGPKFKAENLPLTAKFFDRLSEDGMSIFGSAKSHWHRTRPFNVSSEVKACFDDATSGSYPSGHSTLGHLQAVILANMVPEKTVQIFERVSQYARNRMVCGVHYRSDIEGGRIAGTVIAAFAMQNPEFKKEFDMVRKEIRKTFGLGEQ